MVDNGINREREYIISGQVYANQSYSPDGNAYIITMTVNNFNIVWYLLPWELCKYDAIDLPSHPFRHMYSRMRDCTHPY